MAMKSLFAACILPLSAFAAEYHVATTGADANAGTLAAPWRTVQHAADAVVAGDTVFIHAGTYIERVALENRAGTASAPIVFRSALGENAVLSQLGVTAPDGDSAIFSIRDCDYITLLGLTIRDYETASKNSVPIGVFVSGKGAGIALRECKVERIWQSFAGTNDFGANAHGIAVFGDSAKPLTGVIIDGCEVSDLRLGASEAVVLNGNVTRFEVTNNRVHDCNNIGIDFIGYEGVNPSPSRDRARFGRCAGNVVWNIDSKFNPVYAGNFGAGGDATTQSAPGIYVDGGSDIVIEGNHVFSSNFALSVGSEQPRRRARRIKVRNNIFHHCHVGGIVIGGEDTENSGGASACVFTNNTVWENDLAGVGGGQVLVQHFVSSTSIKRNLIGTTAQFAQLILKDNTTGSFARNAVNWNLYYAPPTADVEFIWNRASTSSFEAWKPSGKTTKDSNSRMSSASPGFAIETPTALSPDAAFRLTVGSTARDSGDSAKARFRPTIGELDYFKKPRVLNTRVDIGAHEFDPAE